MDKFFGNLSFIGYKKRQCTESSFSFFVANIQNVLYDAYSVNVKSVIKLLLNIVMSAVPSFKVDRCIAKAVYTSALFDDTPPLYMRFPMKSAAPAEWCGPDWLNRTLW
jgi:hypothetical protein